MFVVSFYKMLLLKMYICFIVGVTICLILVAPLKVQQHPNNACRTYSGYLNILHSKDCYYIADVFQNVCTIAFNHIGVCEDHEVITEDGYILRVFRLPRENPKDVILLQHAAVCDSRSWMAQYNESTALLFWNAGYDVWMPNNRGTEYSKRHINQTRWNSSFWDFSFHEMGLYDHKATIDYIIAKTNRSKIVFVGHSMSGTTGLIYSSLRPQEAKEKIKVMILMAPVAYLINIKSLLGFGAFIVNYIQTLLELADQYSVIGYDSWYIKLFRSFVFWFPFKILVVNLSALSSGPTPDQFDPNYCNTFTSILTSEMSWKTLYHFGQIRHSDGKFPMYDYGSETNLKIYGNLTPPSYPLERIETPIYIMYSKEDYVSEPRDMIILYNNLPERSKIYGKLELSGLNHIDFHTGKDRITKVYNKIFQLLEYIRKTTVLK